MRNLITIMLGVLVAVLAKMQFQIGK